MCETGPDKIPVGSSKGDPVNDKLNSSPLPLATWGSLQDINNVNAARMLEEGLGFPGRAAA